MSNSGPNHNARNSKSGKGSRSAGKTGRKPSPERIKKGEPGHQNRTGTPGPGRFKPGDPGKGKGTGSTRGKASGDSRGRAEGSSRERPLETGRTGAPGSNRGKASPVSRGDGPGGRGAGTGGRGSGSGGRGTGSGGRGSGSGGRGTGTGSRGAYSGGRGAGTEDHGTGTGSRGAGTRSSGAGSGGHGTGTGSRGAGTRSSGAGSGGRGTSTGSRGTGTGSRGAASGGRSGASGGRGKDARGGYGKAAGNRGKDATRGRGPSKEAGRGKSHEELVRLNKYIAASGICSRREADQLIVAGLVSVNGKTVTELGTKVNPGDDVRYNGERMRNERKVYLLLNKPKDYVTTTEDPKERKTVMLLIKNACPERIYPVGRLDRQTTGVLLFTNDGEMAKKLTHPGYNKKKIYHVFLEKSFTAGDFKKMADGLTLEDGFIQPDAISYVSTEHKREVGLEIHSGKNRVVRRMFESLGYRVLKLDRVYFAGLTKKNVQRGKWRFLSEKEINMLKMNAYE